MGTDEVSYVKEAFETNWIAPTGPNLSAFEEEMCAYTGAQNAVALSSGTAAIHLALQILGVERGDEVFCSTLTFVATANPILYLGAKPVFIDSDEATWNMDPARLEEALADRARNGRLPKAVIAVDIFGHCADYDRLLPVCGKYGVPLIEDAAEALGSTYKGRSAGTFGAFGVYSFNGNKIITTSGGGMLVTPDKASADKARFLSTQARDPALHYEHSQVGYNYRLSNVLAGIGRGQLKVLPDRVKARRANFAYYQDNLGDLEGMSFMPEAEYGQANRWLTCLQIDPATGKNAHRICQAMQDRFNIECRPVWKPLHLQPLYAGAEIVGGEVAGRFFLNGICLPSGSSLSDEQRARVAACFRDVFEQD